MGAGKTSVGRGVARLLHCELIDTDHALKERTGVSIDHIFSIEGEQGFRKRETKLLAEICTQHLGTLEPVVVATGGGLILNETNRAAMTQSGTVVYLRATVDLLWSRLTNSHFRPLLDVPEPKVKLAALLEQREALYTATADFIVDVDNKTKFNVANHIHALLIHENR